MSLTEKIRHDVMETFRKLQVKKLQVLLGAKCNRCIPILSGCPFSFDAGISRYCLAEGDWACLLYIAKLYGVRVSKR